MADFEEAGETFLIEEGLFGDEFSYFAITDGTTCRFFPSAKDYKRLETNDAGPQTGGMGAISLVIASAFLVRDIHKKRQRAWLLSFGVKIKAKFDSISQGNVVINGKTPNIIACQYLDPKDKLLYIYHSDYIWFNPKPHLPKSGDIDVWIDPNNPAKYWVDLSFLPQTAANA